jgi:RNA polymerase sigma factor (sigma-70 family)
VVPVGTSEDQRFGSLYHAHRGALAAYCRRRLPRDVVDDVLAEVFLTVWRRMDQIPSGSELPWMYGVTRNVVSNHQRGSNRRSRLPLRLLSRWSETSSDPTTHMEGDRTVLEALATLSPLDQEILRLRAWEELTSAEIGVVLGISVTAVDMRMSRARRRFEHALDAATAATAGTTARFAEEGTS